MALSRSELRKKCMIILYQIDIYNQQKTPHLNIFTKVNFMNYKMRYVI